MLILGLLICAVALAGRFYLSRLLVAFLVERCDGKGCLMHRDEGDVPLHTKMSCYIQEPEVGYLEQRSCLKLSMTPEF